MKTKKTRKKPQHRTIVVATLVVRRPGRMTEKQHRDVAQWLRDQADALTSDGSQYSDVKFSARCRFFR